MIAEFLFAERGCGWCGGIGYIACNIIARAVNACKNKAEVSPHADRLYKVRKKSEGKVLKIFKQKLGKQILEKKILSNMFNFIVKCRKLIIRKQILLKKFKKLSAFLHTFCKIMINDM